MKYYKIFTNDAFIGVVSSHNFVRYHMRNHFLGPADETTGSLVEYNGIFYRDYWMTGADLVPFNFIQATILETTLEEYERLHAAIEEHNETVIAEEVIVEEPMEVHDALTLEYARDFKLEQLNRICTSTIEAGTDINGRHYSFTTNDQLNLLAAENSILNGATTVMYHADGEDYRSFSAEEIHAITDKLEDLRLKNAIYLKKAKQYIASLTDAESILAFTYGDEIPE